MDPADAPTQSQATRVFHVAILCFGLVGYVGFVLHVIDKVRTGHGLDCFLTGFGVEMNYLGVRITMALIPPVLFVGWIIRIWCVKCEKQALEALSKRMRNREHHGP